MPGRPVAVVRLACAHTSTQNANTPACMLPVPLYEGAFGAGSWIIIGWWHERNFRGCAGIELDGGSPGGGRRVLHTVCSVCLCVRRWNLQLRLHVPLAVAVAKPLRTRHNCTRGAAPLPPGGLGPRMHTATPLPLALACGSCVAGEPQRRWPCRCCSFGRGRPFRHTALAAGRRPAASLPPSPLAPPCRPRPPRDPRFMLPAAGAQAPCSRTAR